MPEAAVPRSVEEWLKETRRLEREGELFRAYDTAMQGVAEHPEALALQHRAVLCLASTGATRQATEKFAALGLERARIAAPDRKLRMDIASLAARLAKDAALASSGAERPVRLRRAAELYGAVFAEESAAGNPEAYYPGINAASWFVVSPTSGCNAAT